MQEEKKFYLKKEKRKELLNGRTLTNLAKALNTSTSYLSDITSGKLPFNVARAYALAYLKDNYSEKETFLEEYFEQK